MRRQLILVTVGLLPTLITSCGNPAEEAAENVVRASIRAEKQKDIDRFLALWTNEGLSEYNIGSGFSAYAIGTRAQLRDPTSTLAQRFGVEAKKIVRFTTTRIGEDRASTVVDIASDVPWRFAEALHRVRFTLVNTGESWLLDGFEDLGDPPVPERTNVVDVRATEFAFILSESSSKGDLAFAFSNSGEQQHELTLFRAPGNQTVSEARAALMNYNRDTGEGLPEGYRDDTLRFLSPEESAEISFASPFRPGTYFMACYTPEGGYSGPGEPVNPDAQRHIDLGMIESFRVD